MIPDDNVVEDFDADDLSGFHQPFRQADILLGDGSIAGRVIMDKDDRGSRGGNRFFEHFPGMDNAGIQTADRGFADFDDPGASIQQHRHEIFFFLAVESIFYQRGDIKGVFNHRLIVVRRKAFQAVSQFKSGFNLAGFGEADAFDLRKLFDRGGCKAFQPFKPVEQPLRGDGDGLTGDTAPRMTTRISCADNASEPNFCSRSRGGSATGKSWIVKESFGGFSHLSYTIHSNWI